MVTYVVAIILIAFIFDFSNGFHDSANSIATVVGTRVLSPFAAVLWAAFFNMAAAFTVGTAVAKTVGSGMIDTSIVTPSVVLGGLLGAIVWNIITWRFGLPSSSSHALIGGYAGAAVAKAGLAAVTWGQKWIDTLLFIVLSPVIGFALGALLMILVYWIFQRVSPSRVDRTFRALQLASSALFSLSHGANDAQKTMGIIVGLLVATQASFVGATGWEHHLYVPNANVIPYWVEFGAYIAISTGTLFGGWRIVATMGSRITRLRPVGGFCAETGGALSILLATKLGIPVSTTHTITGAIVGVGATNRLSAVRWGVAGRIVWAWILTIPAAAAMAAIAYYILRVTIAP
ncbi:MAG: inorganic phosphate transporter [Gemmatimonadaceae bacterium]|nr:inorganic phosphate transporter [Gemmatimonadaceae bacterium]NUQ93757.1 inorganic phosphate transporter [Gemmatimonadaceae bacterium]NUR21221.1 inorganic phosphate transporter [Gemmatimonadaceae bacterium]NUS96387.1 inorganic phosphate transporter [Gemmatimonadaceae bacterium]